MKSYDQEADYRAFVDKLDNLLKDGSGKYAIVHRGEVVAIRATEDAAVAYGEREYGMGSFIAQEITNREPGLVSYALF